MAYPANLVAAPRIFLPPIGTLLQELPSFATTRGKQFSAAQVPGLLSSRFAFGPGKAFNCGVSLRF